MKLLQRISDTLAKALMKFREFYSSSFHEIQPNVRPKNITLWPAPIGKASSLRHDTVSRRPMIATATE